MQSNVVFEQIINSITIFEQIIGAILKDSEVTGPQQTTEDT